MALFPTGLGFVQHRTEPFKEKEVAGEQLAELKRLLAETDQAIMHRFESMMIRPQLHECLKQLVFAGNVLLILDKEKGATVVRMDRYVVNRDIYGHPERIILKEEIRPQSLPEELHELCADKMDQAKVDIYTGVVWDPKAKRYNVHQESLGYVLDTTKGSYSQYECPYLPLWTEPTHQASWGYGFIASYLGDLISLEGLSQSFIEAAAAMSKVTIGVNPMSTLSEEEVAEAPNLAVLRFKEGDLSAFQLDKVADLRAAFDAITKISGDLSTAFLENQSFQRSGERVTAEEIRRMAEQLEKTQAGTYPQLGKTMQLPIAMWIKAQLTKDGVIPDIKSTVAEVSVVTGLEALGRTQDLQRLDSFVMGAMQTFGPEVVADHIDVSDYFTRRATALGLNSDGLVRSAEQVQELQQQRQAADMLQSGIGPAIGAASQQG